MLIIFFGFNTLSVNKGGNKCSYHHSRQAVLRDEVTNAMSKWNNVVDKSVVAMGRLEDLEDGQQELETLLSHVRGFHAVRITDSLADIPFAVFDDPTRAFAFVRG